MAQNLEVSLLLDFYGPLLTTKQREVVEFYHNEDLSFSEIAENEGITRQGVRDTILRTEAILRDMEEKLGLCKRFRDMTEGLERVRRAAQDIETFNDRYGYRREISSRAKEIIDVADALSE